MDGIREFLETVRQNNLVEGHLRGVFHAAIGRRISRANGNVVSAGCTWRQLAAILKAMRFDKEYVTEIGADPDKLSPRDRERFWYSAIALAKVDSPEARAQADKLAALVEPLGYKIGPPPQSAEHPHSSSSSDRGKKKKRS